jgi:hypothetical protein
MNAEERCGGVLVEHRVEGLQPPGVWPRTRMVVLTECFEPGCDGDPDCHERRLPCRWSWRLAHVKTFNGSSFPQRRCPGCDHIRRAGVPQDEAVQA